jgi:hypothetical protein
MPKNYRQSTQATFEIGPIWDADGEPVTGLAYNAAGLAVSIIKGGTTKVDITPAQNAGDHYWIELGLGCYGITLSTTDTATLGTLRLLCRATGTLQSWDDYFIMDTNNLNAFFGASGVLDVGLATETALATAQADLDTITGSNGVTLATTQPNYAPATAGALATHDGKLDTVDGLVDTLIARLTDTRAAYLDAAISSRSSHNAAAVKTAIEAAGSYLALIKAVTDALPNAGALTSLATAANLATVDTVVDAIKAVTDNLPNSGALSSLATSAAQTTAQNDLDLLTGANGATLATLQPNYAPATATNLATVDTVVDAIKVVTDALPNAGALTSLATATNLATVDTVVDGIKAVTDALPNAGALTSLATAAALATVDTVVDAIKVVTDYLSAMLETDGAVKRWTENALEQGPSGTGGGDATEANQTTILSNLAIVDGLIDAIKAVTDALPNAGALTSLATAANLATVDTVVDGIKAVTDALPNAGSLSSLATGAALATAQSDLDKVTGLDGATLATLQPNYAPNKVVPDPAGTAPTVEEILAGTVDGSVALATAVKRVLAVVANNATITGSAIAHKDAAGTATVLTRTHSTGGVTVS